MCMISPLMSQAFHRQPRAALRSHGSPKQWHYLPLVSQQNSCTAKHYDGPGNTLMYAVRIHSICGNLILVFLLTGTIFLRHKLSYSDRRYSFQKKSVYTGMHFS